MEERVLSIVTWNVNGLRAAWRKGMRAWLEAERPDLLMLQEIRAGARELEIISAQLEEIGYRSFWNSAAKPGYAGTGLLTRVGLEPLSLETGLGDAELGQSEVSPLAELDAEGRTVIAYYQGFVIVGCYFPNGTRGPERLAAKGRFYAAVGARLADLAREYEVVVLCGDLNTAHTALDLAYPAANAGNSGFLPIERGWIDDLLAGGFIDAYRHLHRGEPGAYSWWSAWGESRRHDTGWRFDYLLINEAAAQRVLSARIDKEVVLSGGLSDHAPVLVRLAGSELVRRS
jgi:exodeoxyribonuclease-3